MTNNENIANDFEDLFFKISSMYKIRVATFLPNKENKLFEEHLLNKYNTPFPVPFSGKFQSSLDDYDDLHQFEISYEVDIQEANNLYELLTFYANDCEDFFKSEGKNIRINDIKYLSDGTIILFEREHEFDYIDHNSTFFNALINECYDIKFINNNFIRLENNFMSIKIHEIFEPELFIIKFLSKTNDDLTEQEIKSEVVKYCSELKSLGYYPANFSINEFSLINFDSNYYGFGDLKDDNNFYFLGVCLESLHNSRKKISYPSTDENSLKNLFTEINKNEQNRFDTDFKLDDYVISIFQEYISKSYYPSATFNGKDYHFMIINNKGIGDIIVWHYERTESEVFVEYSLRVLTKNLIMEYR
jgi:hypothetical protein